MNNRVRDGYEETLILLSNFKWLKQFLIKRLIFTNFNGNKRARH